MPGLLGLPYGVSLCASSSCANAKQRRTPLRTPLPILLDANSAAQAQACDQRFIALDVLGLDVIEQAAALGHHLDHAAAGMIVLGVRLEVFGEIGDALGQDRDLDFRRTGIVLAGSVFGDDFFLAFRSN